MKHLDFFSLFRRFAIVAILLTLLSCGLGYSDKLDDPCSSSFQNEFGFCPGTIVPTGSLDSDFGTGGIFTHDGAAGGSLDKGYAVAMDSSGSYFVAGISSNGGDDDMALWKLSTDGTLDTSFGGGDGIYVYDSGNTETAWSVTVDGDDKILVAGSINNDVAVWRISTDGTIDTSFGGGDGIYTYDSGGIDFTYALVVQTDGSIVLTGYSQNDLFVIRLTSAGVADTTFGGGDGLYTYDSGNVDFGKDVELQSDGKIVVAGYAGNGADYDMLALRLTSTGTLDTTFDTDGVFTHHDAAGAGGHDMGQSLAIQSDGKIVIAGHSYRTGAIDDMVVWRLTTAGALDTTFDSDGFYVYTHPDAGNYSVLGYSVALASDEKIVVTGFSDTDSSGTAVFDMAVWRFTTAGALDTTFDSDGVYTHDSAAGGSDDDRGWNIAISSTGRYVIAGYSDNASANEDMAVWILE
jgi:uncharacterized delta-60 repeat protein